MSDIDLIKGCAIFSDLSAESLKNLASITQRRTCNRNELLFSEGDEAAALFILISGSIDLVKIAPDGREQLIRSVNKGEMFAEAAMFTGEAYPATAICRSKSELISITKGRFLKYVGDYPEVSLKIMGVMSHLLRHLNALLSDLSLGSVSGRLSAYLLSRARESGSSALRLGIPKSELAFRLGTVPETLSRNLKRLKDLRAIEVSGDQIIIKDYAVLEKLAGR